jgi:hypothetical protein
MPPLPEIVEYFSAIFLENKMRKTSGSTYIKRSE